MGSCWRKIEYEHDERGSIVLPEGPPFDGEPVLIKTASGAVEAWWDGETRWSDDTPSHPREVVGGWDWVCLDDRFTLEWDEATAWCPLPSDGGRDVFSAIYSFLRGI